MSNDTQPLSGPDTRDLSDPAAPPPEPTPVNTGPLEFSDLPEDAQLDLEVAPPDLVLDIHSVPVVPAEPMSQQPLTEQAVPAQQEPAGKPTPAPVQATQAVMGTARQATQQVTAAVQQQAQKITVAPRKAIYRGKRFLTIYAGLAGAAGILAFLARRHRYFVGDVGIARLIQRPNSKLYDDLMHLVSQLGWRWISVGTRASLSTLMWAAGFRMESAFTISTWSGDILTSAIKSGVVRPRPTSDLVRVISKLDEASFPSGHVVHYVTFYGFLFYLVFTHLKRRWFRTALLTLLAGLILLVGPSRVYMGHHWPSDVGGAYLVGSLWLGVIIIAYLETKANYTLHTRPPFFVKRAKQLG